MSNSILSQVILTFYDASKKLPFDHIDDSYPPNDYLVLSDIGGLWRLEWNSQKKCFESKDPEQEVDMKCVRAWAPLWNFESMRKVENEGDLSEDSWKQMKKDLYG